MFASFRLALLLTLAGGLTSLPTFASENATSMTGLSMHSCVKEKCLRFGGANAQQSFFGDIWVVRDVNVEIVKSGTNKIEKSFPGIAFIDETNHRVMVAGKNKKGKRIETVIDLSDLTTKTYEM